MSPTKKLGQRGPFAEAFRPKKKSAGGGTRRKREGDVEEVKGRL